MKRRFLRWLAVCLIAVALPGMAAEAPSYTFYSTSSMAPNSAHAMFHHTVPGRAVNVQTSNEYRAVRPAKAAGNVYSADAFSKPTLTSFGGVRIEGGNLTYRPNSHYKGGVTLNNGISATLHLPALKLHRATAEVLAKADEESRSSRPRRIGENDEFEDDPDPGLPSEPQPIGDVLWLLVLACAYALRLFVRKHTAALLHEPLRRAGRSADTDL